MDNKPLKIVYCTPAIYSAGGVEWVVTNDQSVFFKQHSKLPTSFLY